MSKTPPEDRPKRVSLLKELNWKSLTVFTENTRKNVSQAEKSLYHSQIGILKGLPAHKESKLHLYLVLSFHLATGILPWQPILRCFQHTKDQSSTDMVWLFCVRLQKRAEVDFWSTEPVSCRVLGEHCPLLDVTEWGGTSELKRNIEMLRKSRKEQGSPPVKTTCAKGRDRHGTNLRASTPHPSALARRNNEQQIGILLMCDTQFSHTQPTLTLNSQGLKRVAVYPRAVNPGCDPVSHDQTPTATFLQRRCVVLKFQVQTTTSLSGPHRTRFWPAWQSWQVGAWSWNFRTTQWPRSVVLVWSWSLSGPVTPGTWHPPASRCGSIVSQMIIRWWVPMPQVR